jgi:hypothetical protein
MLCCWSVTSAPGPVLTALPNGPRKQTPASGHCVEHEHCKRRECRLLIRVIKPGRVRRTGQNARRIALNGNGAGVCAGLDRTDFCCYKRRKSLLTSPQGFCYMQLEFLRHFQEQNMEPNLTCGILVLSLL